MSEVTCILSAVEQGDPHAAAQLLPLVYDELRRVAAQKLAQEKPEQTLQATALVHEAYLRLVGPDEGPHWDNRRHFFAAAAEAMRRILVENARRKKRSKHGGDRQRVDLDSRIILNEEPDDLGALDEALARLAAQDSPAAELVKLHFFAGLPVEQAGALLGLSRASAYWLWAYARAWLHHRIGSIEPSYRPTLKSPGVILVPMAHYLVTAVCPDAPGERATVVRLATSTVRSHE